MRRLNLLGLALVSIITGTAQASVLEALPLGLQFTFNHPSSGAAETLSGKKIQCASVSGKGELTSARLGVAELKFVGCAEPSLGIKCTGLEDSTAGNITVKAEFHLRHLLVNGNASGVSLMVLFGHAHFSCSLILLLKLGSICSDELLTKQGGSSVLNLLLSTGFGDFLGSHGDPVVKEVDTDNSLGMEMCQVLVKEGGGEYESAMTLQGEGTIENFKGKNGETVTGLLDLSGTF